VALAAGTALAVGGCTAGIVIAVQGGGSGAGPGQGGAAAPVAAKPVMPLRVVSISPASGEQGVNGAGDITVTYNQAVPATAPLPALSPAVAGTWQRTGDAAVFRPATGFPQGTRVTVTAATGGTGGTATATETASFKTGKYSTLRLQEILAELGYLPLTWTPAAGAGTEAAGAGAATVTGAGATRATSAGATSAASAGATRTAGAGATSTTGAGATSATGAGATSAGATSKGATSTTGAGATNKGATSTTGAGSTSAATVTGISSPAAELSAAYAPPAGTFAWQAGYPAQLRSFWSEGKANTLDRGAVTGFEADHGLPTDGVVGAKVWKALLTAAADGKRNTHGYSYAIASERLPETLTIWHDGHKVFSSPANTGIGVAPTAAGTYPVYEKLAFQIMSGTNPDGSHYADPVSWVSYFNGGDAVHYFDRGSYGWPQSLGCVELPYSAAKDAYPYLPYGTLVTVAY
jgi:hypothetical protein